MMIAHRSCRCPIFWQIRMPGGDLASDKLGRYMPKPWKAGTCFNLVKNIRNWKDHTDMFPICQAKTFWIHISYHVIIFHPKVGLSDHHLSSVLGMNHKCHKCHKSYPTFILWIWTAEAESSAWREIVAGMKRTKPRAKQGLFFNHQ